MRSSALKRLFLSAPKMSMSSSRLSTPMSFASVMKQNVFVSRSIDRRFSARLPWRRPAEPWGPLQLGDVVATLGETERGPRRCFSSQLR